MIKLTGLPASTFTISLYVVLYTLLLCQNSHCHVSHWYMFVKAKNILSWRIIMVNTPFFSTLFHKVECSPLKYFHPSSSKLRSCLGKLYKFESWNIKVEVYLCIFCSSLQFTISVKFVQVTKCKPRIMKLQTYLIYHRWYIIRDRKDRNM